MLMKKLGSPWSTIGTQVDSLLLPVGPLDNRYTVRQKNSTRPSPFSFQFQLGVSMVYVLKRFRLNFGACIIVFND